MSGTLHGIQCERRRCLVHGDLQACRQVTSLVLQALVSHLDFAFSGLKRTKFAQLIELRSRLFQLAAKNLGPLAEIENAAFRGP